MSNERGGAGLAACSGCAGAAAALCVGGARAAHGAGAALGGVAGLALAARALPPHSRHRGIAVLLGAVALGACSPAPAPRPCRASLSCLCAGCRRARGLPVRRRHVCAVESRGAVPRTRRGSARRPRCATLRTYLCFLL